MSEEKKSGKLVRNLTKEEIKVRVSSCRDGKISLILYTDSRTVQNILDEAFGPMGWSREHSRQDGKEFCTISVYDKENGHWVPKSDTGSETFLEKEKGESSDAFKRAAVNWGVARELYSLPEDSICFNADPERVTLTPKEEGKYWCYNNFSVHQLESKDDAITKIDIFNDDLGKRVYRFPPLDNAKKTTSVTTGDTAGMQEEIPSQGEIENANSGSAGNTDGTKTGAKRGRKPKTLTETADAATENVKENNKEESTSDTATLPLFQYTSEKSAEETAKTEKPVQSSAPIPTAAPTQSKPIAPMDIVQPEFDGELTLEIARTVIADKGQTFIGQKLGDIEKMPGSLVWLYKNSLSELVQKSVMLIAKDNQSVAQAFYAKGIAVR